MSDASPSRMRQKLHRGAVALKCPRDVVELTTCDCSIFRRKNASMFKVHEGRFRYA